MKITFEDKEQLITNPNIPRKNKVVADDINEIKRAINDNDDSIEELDTRKADRTEIPTNLNQLSNADTKFVNETQMANAVQGETTARQNADVNLQNQIDAIVAQSDVVDIVGTYQELLQYDTSKITANDIIKVLQDSTHNNATSYFRWANNLWGYVGSEGPYYTKGETDERLNQKANQTSLDQTNDNLNTLSGRVGTNEGDISDIKSEQTTQNNQIATLIADSGNKIELAINSQTYILTATLKNKAGEILNSSQIDLPLEAMIVNATYDSTTKELVLTLQNGTTLRVSLADIVSGLVSQTDFNALELRVVAVEGDIVDIKAEQLTQNAEIDELQTEVENLQETVNSELEDGTATGTSITVNDSAIADGSIGISGRTEQETNIMTYHCEGTETGDYYFTYNNVNYQFTMPTIETGSILAFNTDTLKLYLGDTEITTTTDNTGTLITLQATPNPEYPQTIHKVKGANVIKVSNSDNTESQMLPFTLAEGQEMYEGDYLANDGIHNLRGKIVLDGTENWQKGSTSHVFLLVLPRNTYKKPAVNNCISNYFKGIPYKTGTSYVNKWEFTFFYSSTAGTSHIYEVYINYDINATVEQFKQFLAEKYSNGNPVELVFDINEKTTPYNETQQTQYNALQKMRTYYGETNIETIATEDLEPMLTLNYEKSVATLIADSGHTIELSINSQNYVLTATLKNKAGEILNTSQVDLPLEAMIINATYDSNTKELVLTLQNGNTIRVSIADIISGLVNQTDFNALELRVQTAEGDISDIKLEQLTQNANIVELQEKTEMLENTLDSELENNTTAGTEITVNDSAKYFGSIEVSGNTKQIQYDGYNELNVPQTFNVTGHVNIKSLFPSLEVGQEYIATWGEVIKGGSNNPAIIWGGNITWQQITSNGSKTFTYTEEPNSIYVYSNGNNASASAGVTSTIKDFMIRKSSITKTDYEPYVGNQYSPSPLYPQLIHNVSEANQIKVQNKNEFNSNDWYEALHSISSTSMQKETINGIEYYKYKPENLNNYQFMKGQFLANTQYTISFKGHKETGTDEDATGIRLVYTDGTNSTEIITSATETTYQITSTANKTISYIGIPYYYNRYVLIRDIQLEQGTITTSYIQHQEELLPFTLAEGQKMYIGDYLSNNGIHHITGEIVFNGTEAGWEENGSGTNTYRFMRGVPTLQNAQNGFCNSNKFVTSGVSSDVELAGIVGGNLYYRIKKSTIDSLEGNTNVNKFKNWLSNNPMIIQTKLKTETIESYTQTQQAQYNALQKIRTYFGQTNVDTVTVGDLEPMLTLDYKKSSNLRIKALEDIVFNQ